MGKGIAEKFAIERVNVVLLDILEEEIKETIENTRKQSGNAEGILVDVTDEEKVVVVVSIINQIYGQLDILINNAGISPKDNGKRRDTHKMN
ncbi:SDR family NAD(P)-dependent oxidoreductase [Oceanobacillus sp. CF4.6]|uniref:SDR family NAD(P)-dependent oxidoreductase n=1 Tax=Oceanobacillus sp. CF4.6 TaxID=3373080 RepID=UPI003EE44184